MEKISHWPRTQGREKVMDLRERSVHLCFWFTNCLCMCVPSTQSQAETYRFKEICGGFSKLSAEIWSPWGVAPAWTHVPVLAAALRRPWRCVLGHAQLRCGDSASSLSMIHSPVKPLQLFALPGYCFPYKARHSASAGGEVFRQLLAPLSLSTGG